ncbi:YkuS family protein [Caloramator sp. E03]|uniref:YkuS family protein n=1 Tax=Caloramator sp. E03 TaxID=2576307 RepID=UPI0011100F9E|nr:YkuS family protein [Caloramator sp. E03]QCX34629.1 YkuS family protein [Caloramator sp. E03]
MNKKVAVEQNLDNVREYLEKKGIKTERFSGSQLINASNISKYDAIIVSGSNKDLLGIEDTSTKVPVIDATGMTPEQIYQNLTR